MIIKDFGEVISEINKVEKIPFTSIILEIILKEELQEDQIRIS